MEIEPQKTLREWVREKGWLGKSPDMALIAILFDVLNGSIYRLVNRVKPLEDARSADVEKRAELIGENTFLKNEIAELKRLRGVDKATLNEHERRIDANKRHTQNLESRLDKQ